MPKFNDILGMNARNLKYLRLNPPSGRKVADSKLLTKRLLRRFEIPHPKLIKVIKAFSDLETFEWGKLGEGFVIKPSEGLGGEGILIVKKAGKVVGEWFGTDGQKLGINDFKLHIADILEGRYSRNKTPDQALIEQRIKIHPKFLKYAYRGTPDVRVIVFNHIPVMAMLRLPTKESTGKANLHQGAIALGIDMATGITTYGVHHHKLLKLFPDSNQKVNGIRIPHWEKVLRVAIDAQRASKLGYLGADIVLDQDRGPLILELNDQPGLQIQLANRTGLQERLRRVEDLEVNSQYKGIQIAEVLFAERFSDKVKAKEGRKIIGIFEKVHIKTGEKDTHEVVAKMDTGAYSVSLDQQLATDLGLLKPETILYEEVVQSSLGRQTRPVIAVEFLLQGRKIKALAHVADRSHLTAPMLVGRRYLQDFMVDPSRVYNY